MFPEGHKPHFPSSHHHFGNKITTRIKTISVRKTLKITDLDRYDNSLIQACYLTLFNHFMVIPFNAVIQQATPTDARSDTTQRLNSFCSSGHG